MTPFYHLTTYILTSQVYLSIYIDTSYVILTTYKLSVSLKRLCAAVLSVLGKGQWGTSVCCDALIVAVDNRANRARCR
jgi:hypothetical protein